MLIELQREIKQQGNPEKAKVLSWFFKTGEGQYGHGDVFVGLTVPESRKIALRYKTLSFQEISILLRSKIHEERLIALLILVHNFKKGTLVEKKEIYEFYLSHTKGVNNWDLVDLSADAIVGGYLYEQKEKRDILSTLATSTVLWEKRIAMVATYYFIKHGEHEDALRIAKVLLADKHDLIQKAVGWMLREVGKRCSEKVEEEFLKKHYNTMSRTTLRYAIERFPEVKRQQYLKNSKRQKTNTK